MSLSGRSETVGFLRHAIARIERGPRGAAIPLFAGPRTCATTLGRDTALDKALRNGVAGGALHEIVPASAGDGGAATGFALAMAARFTLLRPKGVLVWVVEDQAEAETGALYAPGLAAHGIDPARLVVVRAASGQEALWATEEALKCRAVAAVGAELWRLKPYDLAASRRLVLAAGRSGTPALLVPTGAAGRTASLSSAARTRFEVRAMRGLPLASTGGRIPLPGQAAWAVRIARIRAGPDNGALALDPTRFWPVLWDHDEVCFRDAFPLAVSAPARDRSHPSPSGRAARDPRAGYARTG